MKPLFIFYLLVFYIVVQFCWWAYLLFDLNREVYYYKIENAQLRQNELLSDSEITDMHKKLEKKWIMVAGEGVVFLIILTIGIVVTRKSFIKENELTRQKKNFLLSVTHEFKSPIAALQLNLQTLLKRNLSEEKQKEFLNNALADTNRLLYLVENVLTATLIENKNYQLHFEPTDLSKTIREQAESLQRYYADKAIIKTDIENNIVCKVDELAINSLLTNLVDNAVKYSTETAAIMIGLKHIHDKAVLTVADSGRGIADEEKSKVFDKFYRTGDENTRKTKGTGLGLYIVKQIVNVHEGEINIKDNHPAGTIFEIIFK